MAASVYYFLYTALTGVLLCSEVDGACPSGTTPCGAECCGSRYQRCCSGQCCWRSESCCGGQCCYSSETCCGGECCSSPCCSGQCCDSSEFCSVFNDCIHLTGLIQGTVWGSIIAIPLICCIGRCIFELCRDCNCKRNRIRPPPAPRSTPSSISTSTVQLRHPPPASEAPHTNDVGRTDDVTEMTGAVYVIQTEFTETTDEDDTEPVHPGPGEKLKWSFHR